MSEKSPKFEASIKESILSEQAVSLASEYSEIALDSILQDGILKDIPVINTIIGISKASIAMRDRLLIKKIVQFLAGLNDVSSEKRIQMINRLEQDTKFSQSVGEHILEVLERVESHRKPIIIARVFAAYAKKEIDTVTLLRLNSAIERLPSFEIENLRPFHNRSKEAPFLADEYTIIAFLGAGFAFAGSGVGGTWHNATDLCKVFIRLGLDL